MPVSSGYVHLSCGGTTIIADAGPAPPFEFASEAHAGCLSFEMSAGSRLVFVNGGAPGPANFDQRPVSRATASHNTLCLAETSSSKLVRHARLDALIGGSPIKGPAVVRSKVEDINGELVWTGMHDGYYGRFGILHHRRLALSASGSRVSGTDRLAGANPGLRLMADLPFSIHFHLHPEARCRMTAESGVAEVITPDGQTWRFQATGADLSIEESTYFADSSGPRRTLQFVLRGSTFGESEVSWQIEARA